MNIETELAKVSRLIQDRTTHVNNEANAKGALYSGIPIVQKIEGISQVLEDEISKLLANFTSKKDLRRINEFIDEQEQQIYKSAETHGLANGASLSQLDSRVEELRGIIGNKRIQIAHSSHKELVRFWVPVTISLAALIMSIISLIVTGGHSE